MICVVVFVPLWLRNSRGARWWFIDAIMVKRAVRSLIGDSTIMNLFSAALEMLRFTMKRRLQLDIAQVVAQFLQKNER